MKYIKTFENIDTIKDSFTKNLEYIDKLKDKLKNIHKIINDYFESNGCEVENYIDGGKWESEYHIKNKNKHYNCKVSLYILDRKINIDVNLIILFNMPLEYGYGFILELFEKINGIKLINKTPYKNDNNYHFADKFQFKVVNPNKTIDELTKQVDLFKSVKKYNL